MTTRYETDYQGLVDDTIDNVKKLDFDIPLYVVDIETGLDHPARQVVVLTESEVNSEEFIAFDGKVLYEG